MIKFSEEIVIQSPIEAVFNFVADPTNMPRYQSDVLSTRVEGPGPIQPGTRFEESVKMGPWTLETSGEVVQLERPRRVAFTAENRALACRAEYAFEPVGQGTRVRASGTGQLRGWWRLLEPVMRAETRKVVPLELERLRRCFAAAIVAALLVVVGPFSIAAAADAPPRPPEMKKTVDAFKGNWVMDTTVTAPGSPPAKAPLKMTCRETAAAKAVTCEMSGNIPGSGPLEAAFIVGFDTFGKRVHFMAMTSDEEVHDHVCRWNDATTLACDPLKGGLMGDAVTEDLVITSEGQKLSFKSAMTLKDGTRIGFDAVGRRKK